MNKAKLESVRFTKSNHNALTLELRNVHITTSHASDESGWSNATISIFHLPYSGIAKLRDSLTSILNEW